MEAKVILAFLVVVSVVEGSSVRNIFWNTTTAARLGDKYPVVKVNEGNQAWEYDQVNIICPVSKEGEEKEEHIIYSVEKEEFEHCRVTSARPRIVAICNRPRTFMYFTLTFRSFTPTPGGLEFRPGQDYYFVSTSSKLDIHRRVGGYCATHNMRMIFKIAERNTAVPSVNSNEGMVYNSPLYKALRTSTARPRSSSTTSTSRPPIYYYKGRTPSVHTSDYIYYYSPRDLVQLKLAARNKQKQSLHPNEIEGAAKLTGAASVLLPSLLLLPFLTCLL